MPKKDGEELNQVIYNNYNKKKYFCNKYFQLY